MYDILFVEFENKIKGDLKMSKILIVSRDNVGAKMSVPTALLALERGHEVGLVVEGLAADRFQDAGLFNVGSKAKLLFKGPVDVREVPFSVDPDAILKQFVPDVVVATRSFPFSLESQIGVSANKRGIPVVLFEDFWNGNQSFLAKPDMIVTMDEYAAKLAASSHPSSNVVVAGNPTVIDISLDSIPDDVRSRVRELRSKFGRVLIFAGGNPDQMTAELEILIECLRITERWCLISRPHPTIAKGEKEPGLKWSSFWNGMLAEFGERIVPADCKVGDHLAVLCDATISGFSLMLNTAAYARKAAISIQTEKGREELFASVKLSEVPIVALGCAGEITQPCNLDALIQPADEVDLMKLKPFDHTMALDTIEALIGK